MCRFAAYLGHPITLDELLYRPDHSIIVQSAKAKEDKEPLNGDGFGVGWYVPELSSDPALYRNATPAWADTNMRHIAPRVRTPLFLAHVRDASPGMAVQQTNCHPFVEDRLSFMHNGYIGGFDELKRPLRGRLSDDSYFGIEGNTDSEHLFAVIQDELGPRAKNPNPEDLANAAQDGLGRVERLKHELGIDEKTTANFALSDGRSLIAVRYANDHADRAASLYVSRAGSFECEDGVTHAVDQGEEGAVLVSSEPMIDQDVGLDPIPRNHLLMVRPDSSYQIEPLNLDRSKATSRVDASSPERS
jgi:ergothioneine biosynthesis protein EgtC